MALASSIGNPSGSIDAISIPVTVFDDAEADITESAAVTHAQTDAPTSFFGVNQDPLPSIQRIAPFAVVVTVSYRYKKLTALRRPAPPEAGTLVRRAAFQARSKTMSHYLAAGKVYNNSGDVTSGYPKLKWNINAHYIPNVGNPPQPTSVEPLPETRTLDYYAPNSAINDTFLDAVEAVCGHFNSGTFKGRPAGTVQLVRFSCSERTPDDFELSFGFGYAAEKTSVSVSDTITVASIMPHDYLWLQHTTVFDATENDLLQTPRLAIVGRVWDLSDLTTILDLP